MLMNISLLAILLACFNGMMSSESPGIDDSDHQFVKNVLALNSSTTDINSNAAAVNYGRTHPNRDGGSWNGW